MIYNFSVVILTLIIFATIGVGPYRLICPTKWKESPFSFMLAIAYGISFSIISNCIFLSYEVLFNDSIINTLIISISFGIISFFVVQKKNKFNKTIVFNKLKIALIIIITSLIPLVILKSNSALNLRLGIDIALYTEAAEALVKNKLFSDLHGFAVDCFFLHFRWGEPILIGFVHKILRLTSPVLNSAYLINASLYGFLIAMSAFLFYSCGKMDLKYSLIGSLFMLFNVNIIFILTEGQWPHFISIPFIILFIICWFHLRENIFEDEFFKLSITMIMMFATILIIISEIVPLLIAISIFIAFLDVLFKNYNRFFKTQYVFFGVVILVFLLLYKFTIIEFTHNGNLLNHILKLKIKTSGYPLPHFSWPFEILGHSNIYYYWQKWFESQGMPFHIIKREYFELIVIFIGSIVVSSICIFGLLKMQREKSIFWLPYFVIPFLSYFYYKYFQSSSYIYTKIITTFIPFMLLPYVSFFANSDEYKIILYFKNTKIYINNILISLLMFFSVVSFLQYIYAFEKSSKIISISTPATLASIIDNIPIYDQANCAIIFAPRGRNNFMLRLIDRNMDYVLSTLVGCTVIDEWETKAIETNMYRDFDSIKKLNIYLIVNKTETIEINNIKSNNKYKVNFENEEWIMFNTNTKVNDYILMQPLGSVNLLNKILLE